MSTDLRPIVSNNRCDVSIIRLIFNVLIYGRSVLVHFVSITRLYQLLFVFLISGFYCTLMTIISSNILRNIIGWQPFLLRIIFRLQWYYINEFKLNTVYFITATNLATCNPLYIRATPSSPLIKYKTLKNKKEYVRAS